MSRRAALAPDARIVCPYCQTSGKGPSADGLCNACVGSGWSTPARFREDEAHRRRILAKYGRCSLPAPTLPLQPL